jgi:hypothetical protein
MELIKTHQKVVIRLSIVLLGVLLAVGSIGYKAATAHADSGSVFVSINAPASSSNFAAFNVQFTASGQTMTVPCTSLAANGDPVTPVVDAGSNVQVNVYVNSNCSGNTYNSVGVPAGAANTNLNITIDSSGGICYLVNGQPDCVVPGP